MQEFYCRQINDWSCGPAAMQMVLHDLSIKLSQQQLIVKMGSNSRRGTAHVAFSKLAKKLGLNYSVWNSTNIAQLKAVLEQGYRVITCYYLKSESIGHYAVIRRITNKRIFLLDPWCGSNHSYSINYFKRIWYDGKGLKGWCIGLSK